MIIDAKRKDIKFYLDFLLVFVDGVYPTSGNRASSEWMDSAPKNGIIEFELIEHIFKKKKFERTFRCRRGLKFWI